MVNIQPFVNNSMTPEIQARWDQYAEVVIYVKVRHPEVYELNHLEFEEDSNGNYSYHMAGPDYTPYDNNVESLIQDIRRNLNVLSESEKNRAESASILESAYFAMLQLETVGWVG